MGKGAHFGQKFLQGASSVLVNSDLDEVGVDYVQNLVDLVRFRNLNELLAQIIGVLVDHKHCKIINQHI